MSTLAELRVEWELGEKVILEHDDDPGFRLLVVIGWPDDPGPPRYRCHRYFRLRDRWELSVDCERATAEEVMHWLTDPKAFKTKTISEELK